MQFGPQNFDDFLAWLISLGAHGVKPRVVEEDSPYYFWLGAQAEEVEEYYGD